MFFDLADSNCKFMCKCFPHLHREKESRSSCSSNSSQGSQGQQLGNWKLVSWFLVAWWFDYKVDYVYLTEVYRDRCPPSVAAPMAPVSRATQGVQVLIALSSNTHPRRQVGLMRWIFWASEDEYMYFTQSQTSFLVPLLLLWIWRRLYLVLPPWSDQHSCPSLAFPLPAPL